MQKFQNEETIVENQQRSESVAVANYEPLSPDTSDAAPTSQTGYFQFYLIQHRLDI